MQKYLLNLPWQIESKFAMNDNSKFAMNDKSKFAMNDKSKVAMYVKSKIAMCMKVQPPWQIKNDNLTWQI